MLLNLFSLVSMWQSIKAGKEKWNYFGRFREVNLSSLGMNCKGEVRSASEFKAIFDEDGCSLRPYRCPFCEVSYEDRCIITECVKAPHFALPKGFEHRYPCNGEAIDEASASVDRGWAVSSRVVVGNIELPAALVKRRNATRVRLPGDDGRGPPPSEVEIQRRRKLVASDQTISNNYTVPQLRPIIDAYKRLKKHAYEVAVSAKFKPGTPEYNESFRNTLNSHRLALYEQKLTYGTAFQGNKLSPRSVARVYFGSGTVRLNGDFLIIKDVSSWPTQVKGATDFDAKASVPLEVRVSRTLLPNAPTIHVRTLEDLERRGEEGQAVEWYAYGTPVLQGDKFELQLDSVDHIYWVGQFKR